jgi:hypothetical protein
MRNDENAKNGRHLNFLFQDFQTLPLPARLIRPIRKIRGFLFGFQLEARNPAGIPATCRLAGQTIKRPHCDRPVLAARGRLDACR